MLRSSFAAAVFLLATCAVTTSHGATVVFFDSEFPDDAWEASIFWTLGDGGTVEAWQVATGGDPGAYRQIRNTVFDAPPYAAVAGFHRHLASTYNPALGGIVTIDNWSLTLHTDTPVTVESATWSGVKALFE